MFVRNLLILAVLAPTAIITALAPLAGMCIAAVIFVWLSQRGTAHDGADIQLESPVSLLRVLSFALLFLAIQVCSTLGQRYLGKYGFLVVSFMGGLVSSASTSAAAANMVARTHLHTALASEGVVLASVASALVNVPILHRRMRNPALIRRLAVLTVFITSIVITLMAIQEHVLWARHPRWGLWIA